MTGNDAIGPETWLAAQYRKAGERIAELEEAYITADADAAGWATKADALEADRDLLLLYIRAARRAQLYQNYWTTRAILDAALMGDDD